MASPGGTRLETALKTGRNWNDKTAETLPPSGSKHFSGQKATCDNSHRYIDLRDGLKHSNPSETLVNDDCE